MQKILICVLWAFVCLTGCSDLKRVKNQNVGKLEATQELVKVGTKKFRLDTETKNRPPYSQVYQGKAGEEILTFLNPRKNAIYFYRYADTTYLSQIAFEREGGNAILGASGYFVKNLDSIYVMNRPMMEVVLADSTGKVRSRIPLLENMRDAKWPLYYPQYILSAVAPMTVWDNHLLLPGFAPFSRLMENRKAFRFMASIDLSTQAVSYHHLYPESLFGDNANWGGDLIQMPYPAFSPDGKMVYSFPNSHDLYLAEWNKDEMTSVYGGSNEIGAICSLDCGLDQTPPNEQLLSYYLGQDWYAAILYDSYRKVYYRYWQKGVPSATSDTPFNSQVVSIIMMDEHFRYLGETEIGSGERWNWSNSFVTAEGLNIEYNGTEIEDDDYLTFGIFLPQKK